MASREDSARGMDEQEDHVQSTVTKALNPAAPEFGPVWPLPRPPRSSAALRPLVFTETVPGSQDRSVYLHRSRDLPLPCVMCEQCFGAAVEEGVSGSVREGGCESVREGGWESARDLLLQHLLEAHKIVIHQVSLIASLRRYCEHWRELFSHSDISQFCPVIRTNTLPSDPAPSEEYYLMSDALPEDKQLRETLQQQRLEAILDQQQLERQETDFKRSCLFCGFVAMGNRAVLFQHMLTDHGFNVGQPDNLVFVNEFLDLLQQKLDNLLCLYCEKVFRDRATLKEHMRKKQHKKINPSNKEYDRFYVVNYLEMGKTWQEVQAEEEERGQADESWEDWTERQPLLHCLFCSSFTSPTLPSLTQHMRSVHQFDLAAVAGALDYYQQVKLVNYVRRQVHSLRCPHCLQHCQSEAHLLLHMGVKGHCFLPPEQSLWDQAQYLFPTFENDALLYSLEDRTPATPTTHEATPLTTN